MSISADGSPNTHVVTGLLRDSDRLLLCHRSPRKLHHPNVWGLPGGVVEPGEPPEAALVRELQEELDVGIAAPAEPLLHQVHGATFVIQTWLIETWTGDPVNAAPEEHDAIAWFTADELGELPLAHDSYLAVFRQVLTGPRT